MLRSPPMRVIRRARAELGDRGPVQAVADLGRLVKQRGPKGLIERLGYTVTRHTPAPTGPTLSPRIFTHAWGSAHSPGFDLTPEALAANRAVVEQFADRPTEVRTATWFLTWFEHPLFGGVHTILRLMSWMKEHHGVEHRLVVFDRPGARDEDLRSAITAVFPNLADIDILLPVDGQVPDNELPATDIGVCTMWVSAYPLARFNRTKAKFYMVADYEPLFYAAGTVYALAEATYRFGFAGIVNTPALGDLYADYGNPTVSFVPSVGTADAVSESAPPKPSAAEGAPVQIVLYGRPSTERNGFELIAAACRHIKERYGDRVRIVSAGEDWEPADFRLEGIIENRGLLRDLASVRQLYEDSDIGVCFMFSKHPSYQPLEYLAHHVVPVRNINPATSWLLRHEENCLITEPFPQMVTAAVSRLIDEPELRAKLAAAGHDDVTSVSWDAELAKVWDFVTNHAG